MPRVSFLHPEGRSGEVEANLTLLEAAKALGFNLNHDCGGNASCTTCRVGNPAPPRPRNPAFLISPTISSGVKVVRHFLQAS